jgi:hypothetical protein
MLPCAVAKWHGPELTQQFPPTPLTHRHGGTEAGIDGGGLFKDFMDEVLRQGFDPQVGKGRKGGRPLFLSVLRGNL